jgi:hypothetical protein
MERTSVFRGLAAAAISTGAAMYIVTMMLVLGSMIVANEQSVT